MTTSTDTKPSPVVPIRREDQKARELIQRILLMKAAKRGQPSMPKN